jgi:hypothetical protein
LVALDIAIHRKIAILDRAVCAVDAGTLALNAAAVVSAMNPIRRNIGLLFGFTALGIMSEVSDGGHFNPPCCRPKLMQPLIHLIDAPSCDEEHGDKHKR